MVELLRSNDLVFISWVEAMLEGDGIETLVVDLHTSSIEGSIGVLPRRLLVEEDDYERARRLLDQASGATFAGRGDHGAD